MRILITGGAGFIGSHIAAAYVRDGHEVAVLDNFRTGSKRNLPAAATLFVGDISQAADVAAAFEQFQPEVVSHYAAQLDVRHSLEDPAHDAATNILGGLNVLIQAARGRRTEVHLRLLRRGHLRGHRAAARRRGDARAAFVALWSGPNGPLNPTSTSGGRYTGSFPSFSATPMSTGPRQNAEGEAGVIAIFSRRLLRGKSCVIYGGWSARRATTFTSATWCVPTSSP